MKTEKAVIPACSKPESRKNKLESGDKIRDETAAEQNKAKEKRSIRSLKNK